MIASARVIPRPRTVLAAFIAVLLILGAAGMVALSPAKAHAAAKPKISATSKKAVKGQSFTLKVKNAPGKKIGWKSSNKKVATVSKKGKVTAKKAGSATITATVAGKKLTCKVKVYGSAKQKALASLDGWWHTWSSAGHYMYVKGGKAYLFPTAFDGETFVPKTSNMKKTRISLTRTATAPGSSEKRPGYRVRISGNSYYYYDNDHKLLENRYGTGYRGYSGSSSMDKVSANDVPSHLRQYVKRF